MSTETAQLLLDWANREDGFTQALPGRRDSDVLRLVGRIASPLLIDLFLRELGPDGLVFTTRGLAVRMRDIRPLTLAAAALLQRTRLAEKHVNEESRAESESAEMSGESGSLSFPGDTNDPTSDIIVEAVTAAAEHAEAVSSGKSSPPSSPSAVKARKPLAPPRSVKAPVLLKRKGFVPWKLCDVEEVAEQLSRNKGHERERERILKLLVERPVRYLPVASRRHVDALHSLRVDFPNFGDVIDGLISRLQLQVRLGEQPLRLPTMLMLGAPGLGKTAFSVRLATVLGFSLEVRSLAELSAGFILTGNDRSWSESKPGLISSFLAQLKEDEAPLLVLDELDKGRSESHFSPDQVLLGMLEAHTAKRWRDEHLDLCLDISPMSFAFTANLRERVRPELLSRMSVREVWRPRPEDMPAIVRSVDRSLREEMPALSRLFAPLSGAIEQALASTAPRQLRRLLEDAYTRASERCPKGDDLLIVSPEDLQGSAGLSVPNVQSSAREAMVEGRSREIPLLLLGDKASRRVH